MNAAPLPVLYSFRRCPYAMRARLAIASSGVRCELREVVLREKPPELVVASAKATVPVLVEPGGAVLEESLDIMLWALRAQDPETILPPDPAGRNAMEGLITRLDGPFKQSLDRYKYGDGTAGDGVRIAARDAASDFLMELEARLSAASWLFGAAPRLADFAVLPFVRQFAFVDRAWFDRQPWPRLRAWLDRFLESDRFRSVMVKYPKWRAGERGIVFP